MRLYLLTHGAFADIQYELNADTRAHYRGVNKFVQTIFYSALQEIIKCTLRAKTALGLEKEHLYLLAVIARCKTQGAADATIECVTFDDFQSTVQIIDLNATGSVVGRMRCGTAVSMSCN